MAEEVFSGGYAVEYICRVVDETEGKESVPETATMAQTNLIGKGKVNSGGTAGAADATDSSTDALLNSALRVSMPVLNGVTDGMASQAIDTGKKVIRLGEAISVGSAAAIGAAAAPLITMAISGVMKIIQGIQSQIAQNDAVAESLDQTNLLRQMAGLDKINYTRTGITKKVRMEEYR